MQMNCYKIQLTSCRDFGYSESFGNMFTLESNTVVDVSKRKAKGSEKIISIL